METWLAQQTFCIHTYSTKRVHKLQSSKHAQNGGDANWMKFAYMES